MDKQKIINLANKGLEMVSEMSIENRYKNLLGDIFFEMRKEAINYTRCSTQLQTENKALSFEDWTNLNNYKFQRTTYFDENGTIYFDKELKQMYKQYLSSL
jgi:predicted choloylglycine hydrolase